MPSALSLIRTLFPDARERSRAIAISETAYELGVALGVAVRGSLVTLGYQARTAWPAGLPADVRTGAGDSLAPAVALAGDRADVVEAAREAFVAALQTACVVAAVLTALAAVVAWRLIPSERGGDAERQGAVRPH